MSGPKLFRLRGVRSPDQAEAMLLAYAMLERRGQSVPPGAFQVAVAHGGWSRS